MSDEPNMTDGELLAKHQSGHHGYYLPDGSRTRSAERCIASWRAGAVVASTRGRPVGSKNKPKSKPEEAPVVETVVEASPEPVEAPAQVKASTMSDYSLEERIEHLEAVFARPAIAARVEHLEARIKKLDGIIDRLLTLTSRAAETQSVAAESLRHQWLAHD